MNIKNSRLITNIILVVVLAVLSIVMITTAFQTAKSKSIQQMDTMTDERAIMIENYVAEAEYTLSMYSSASEIIEVCKHPTNDAAIAAAQDYTTRFSKSVENLEGVYVSMWTTQVLAHTNPKVVGMITRKEEAPRKQLQDAMLAAGDGVYNTGIILSPAAAEDASNSEKQIISLYKAVYDENHKAIGLVGLGIYTKGLVNAMDNLSKTGLENATYSMVNVADGKYVFVDDETQIGTATSDDAIIDACNSTKNATSNKTGNFETEKNGTKYICTYSYRADKGWLMMIDNPRNEIYAFANRITLYLSLFCAVCLIIILLFNIISKRQEETNKRLSISLKSNEATQEKLNNAVMYDLLTDTYTRIAFLNDFDAGAVKEQAGQSYFFMMTTVNHFSDINAKFGMDVGDQVLFSVAEALKTTIRDSKTYRVGSDEFITVVALPSADGRETVMNAANAIAKRFSRPLGVNGRSIQVTCPIAIVKKTKKVNNSVIVQMKNMILTNPQVPITYNDLDA